MGLRGGLKKHVQVPLQVEVVCEIAAVTLQVSEEWVSYVGKFFFCKCSPAAHRDK